ncbi:hypothetical protein AGMMS50262_06470 [Bacteroidia bacterium]|nr:hypothetical protein AGMMS50262_06470 [Bacteroidia bacterium]
MKTYFYITVLLLAGIPSLLSAQPVLRSELNMFRAGDILYKQQVEYKDPGRTGASVLWDFSQLNVVNDEYELRYFAGEQEGITGMEHLTLYHYSLRNDSLLLLGFENQTTQLKNRQPELLLHFPVNYGDTAGSYFYGHGKYGNRLELDEMGTIATAADSYGMMILPSKDTLKQVLRTRTLKVIAEESRPIGEEYYYKDTAAIQLPADSIDFRLATDSVLFVVETFRWYEKGYRYPVFETVRSWEQHRDSLDHEFLATAFFYPPQEQYFLSEDEANSAVLEAMEEEAITDTIVDPWAGLTWNIFPNPVKNSDLSVEIYLPKNANNVHVQLRNPMGLIVSNKDLGFFAEGTHAFGVDTWTLPVGNYILDIWLDEKLISEIILKR